MVDTIKNETGLNLSMAVWLAHEEYDNGAAVAPEGELTSATQLLKPTRQFILSQRVPKGDVKELDVLDLVSSRLGHAIHGSIELAWSNYKTAMAKLGYPQKAIDAVKINPTEVKDGDIPVYLEQRYFREIDGVIIGGQFDQIISGEINDIKTTSVYTYLSGSKQEDYRLQLSIYRWLNPEKVTSDVGYIQHVFTDWQGMMVNQNPDYPKSRVLEVRIKLMSLEETEMWIRKKIAEIRRNIVLDQRQMVRCTDKELWRDDPKWKYYTDPEKAKLGGRATRSFDTAREANEHLASKGRGVVIMKPGKVKACQYCAAFPVCSQKDEYFND